MQILLPNLSKAGFGATVHEVGTMRIEKKGTPGVENKKKGTPRVVDENL